jgi:D-glycerate 3-kinase
VNAQLAGPYAAFFGRLDALAMLRVPEFDAVRRWREAQEVELRARTGGGMSPEEIRHFVDHYERVTRQQLAALPGRSDLCLELDADHAIVRIR